ncbi:SDR family NAD(P)-dependent oxidoreductase [Thiomicrorhabdus sediminis]|uniref:SDR family NAD(P)-dependent oxidoreductase n=1 Tax=Thiomicrorhabdus sediminis TaxID=2580412 RepID=A0A4P9K4P1_9GAMM|nr:SDR family NAD(P)-dependent oxidoreductase [Thiomicrorhabdus sediminis]QCU89909.1 SDR family NAD(P)-dependent oxidoreductase [Thiomicrorhabdus sediminis]
MHSEHKLHRIWLIGGSQGIGFELTQILLDQGHKLVVSSRGAESSLSLLKLQKKHHSQLKLLNLDVTKNQQIESAVKEAIAFLEVVDIAFYNAGTYTPMKMSEWQMTEFEKTNDINYLGAVRMLIALKECFLNQGHGRWIWNISLAADFGLPYGGAYSAPKAALMNLAESLQPELKAHNIQLQVINHGFVKTRLTAKNDFVMLGLMDAEQAAAKIAKVFNHNKFETRFPFSLSSLLGTLKRLPKSWTLAITQKALKDEDRNRQPHKQ